LRGFLSFGNCYLVQGEEKVGKGMMLCSLVARLAMGLPMPDGSRHKPGATLWLTTEDEEEYAQREAGGPERPVPVRERQEVQEVLHGPGQVTDSRDTPS
jgi:hypothetical protein